MKQQLGKGKLEILVAQRLIDGEYPVELPFLLCFIKTNKKSNTLFKHHGIPTCAVVLSLTIWFWQPVLLQIFYMRTRLIAVWSVIISGLIWSFDL